MTVSATLDITTEGISVELTGVTDDGTQVVLDEAWLTWSEVVADGVENWSAFDDVEIEPKRFTLEDNR
jgi:hypothetical protein